MSGQLHAQASPEALEQFWKQWYEQKLDLQTPKAQKFIRENARHWTPAIIPALIHDVIAHEPKDGELRDYVYATAVTEIPDQEGCRRTIAGIRSSPGSHKSINGNDSVDEIAYDFQSAMEESAGAKKGPITK